MWQLASFLASPIVKSANVAYKAKLDAANSQDQFAADPAAKEIEAEIESRKQGPAIIIAEQGRWYTAVNFHNVSRPVDLKPTLVVE